jgi:hypothetical protein
MSDELEPIPPKPVDDIMRALAKAQAPWQRDGQGIRGPNPTITNKQPDPPPEGRWPIKIESPPATESFPKDETPSVTREEGDESSAETNTYSFKGTVASIDKDAGTVEVHVGYGEINEEPPDGMSGADDYFLTISVDGTEIYAVITYDPDTLEITSRSLAFASEVPESELGTLYVPLIAIDIDTDGSGNIREVVVRNRHCGDIIFALIYGSVNGKAAIIPLANLGDWAEVNPDP